MSSSPKHQKLRKRSRVKNLLLAGILISLIFTACAAEPSVSSESADSVPSSAVSSSSLSSETSSSSSASSEPVESSSSEYIEGAPEATEPGISVETQHMSFYYPAELEETFIVRHSEEEGNQTVAFCSEISGEELELFAVVLGTADENDFTLGILQDDTAGEVPVSIRMNVQDPADWSAEDFERINALQERVNDIIIQFYEDPRFVPEQG